MIFAIICLAAAGGLVAADQLIKLLVTTQLQPVGSVTLIPNLLEFTYVENRGAAFSMLSGSSIIFIVITAVVCAALIAALFVYKKHNWLSYFSIAMIVAGGIGNLIDRIFHEGGFVTDYIHVMFFPAIFNFADILVVVGVGLLILFVIFFFGRGEKKQPSKRGKV